jgi:hypothetical protein
VVLMKLALFLYCRGSRNPAVRAFALDHLNDVLVNGIGLGGEEPASPPKDKTCEKASPEPDKDNGGFYQQQQQRGSLSSL